MTNLFLLLPWILFGNTAAPDPSCSCNDMGPFLTVSNNAPVIALVKVNRFLTTKQMNIGEGETAIPLSMEVEIVDIYKGSEERKRVTVWGDNGILCRPYLTSFTKEEFFVIALSKVGTGRGHGDEKLTDYFINGCGTYWLKTDKAIKLATGRISESKNEMTLGELKERVGKSEWETESPKDQLNFRTRF
ncbi:MAG: hypothetical protein H7Y42_02545 [Chitinophagaceae bacterium]|nr:hypothetical protein [Chitinophagaceae bacterium]